MAIGRFCRGSIMFAVLFVLAVSVSGAASLIADGDFTLTGSSKVLRADNKGQDWYESRQDTKAGHRQLFLSKKAVGGDATPKAMLKANLTVNTYLTQKLATPQTGDFTVQYDILIKEIVEKDNRSAFFLVGTSSDKKGGPNSTGAERFVFLGFENAAIKGKVNLFAREGNAGWDKRKIVAGNLDLGKWYTITVAIHPASGSYDVTVQGVTAQPVKLNAFAATRKPLKRLTHLSFATWNDGAGTFYVDNVSAQSK